MAVGRSKQGVSFLMSKDVFEWLYKVLEEDMDIIARQAQGEVWLSPDSRIILNEHVDGFSLGKPACVSFSNF